MGRTRLFCVGILASHGLEISLVTSYMWYDDTTGDISRVMAE